MLVTTYEMAPIIAKVKGEVNGGRSFIARLTEAYLECAPDLT